jgi:Fe-S cluster assembly protein SufB
MANEQIIDKLKEKYALGFSLELENETVPKGLNEEVITLISTIKQEPQWLLDWRLNAYRHWLTLKEPQWANVQHPPIDYQDIYYYSAPKKAGTGEKKEIDPELMAYYEKLGVPLNEREILAGNVAVDAIMDSVSVGTTFKVKLEEAGVLFCSFSEAVQKYPDLVQKYLGSVVSYKDNYFASLNSAVFTDGSFCFIPAGVKCPMELSTYFRINQAQTGQFERTLIIAEEGASVRYLEGCSAPSRPENQLHAAVVELIALEKAKIEYSTVQNWYPGDENGKGGVYNFVTKRGECRGDDSEISWTQIETGSAITWKYPSVILRGKRSKGYFYSVALTNHHQQADTGTKMIHLGEHTSSTIIAKSISAGKSVSTYRGLVRIAKKAIKARNFTQCDSLIFGQSKVHTDPYIENYCFSAKTEHEATTSPISEEHLFYLMQHGLSEEQAKNMLVNGFCKSVFQKLPGEFAVEAQRLLEINLEGSMG